MMSISCKDLKSQNRQSLALRIDRQMAFLAIYIYKDYRTV